MGVLGQRFNSAVWRKVTTGWEGKERHRGGGEEDATVKMAHGVKGIVSKPDDLSLVTDFSRWNQLLKTVL